MRLRNRRYPSYADLVGMEGRRNMRLNSWPELVTLLNVLRDGWEVWILSLNTFGLARVIGFAEILPYMTRSLGLQWKPSDNAVTL